MLRLFDVAGSVVDVAAVGAEYVLLFLQRRTQDLTLRVDGVDVEAWGSSEPVPRWLSDARRVVLVGGWMPVGVHACEGWAGYLWGWRLRFRQSGEAVLRVGSCVRRVGVEASFAVAGGSDGGLGVELVAARLVWMGAGRKLYVCDVRVPDISGVFDARALLSESAVLHLSAEATESARLLVEYDDAGRALLVTTDHGGNPLRTGQVWRCQVWCD